MLKVICRISFLLYVFLYIYFFKFTPFSWYPIVSSCLIAKTHIRARERRRSKAMRPPKHNPTKRTPNTARIQPGSQPHQCVGGNTVHLATWLACTAPSPPQESLVRDETRISVPAKPSLTRSTLGQLCVAPRTSPSRTAATEPGHEPRVSGGTASTTMQCPRPLRHPGGTFFISLSQSAVL